MLVICIHVVHSYDDVVFVAEKSIHDESIEDASRAVGVAGEGGTVLLASMQHSSTT